MADPALGQRGDQQGQDRYSTEVVLQGFNSALTMLDGRQGGGGEFGDAGSDFGQSGPRQPARAPAEELDDEIPF